MLADLTGRIIMSQSHKKRREAKNNMANKRRSPASSGKLLEMARETLTYTLTTTSVTTLTTVDLDLLPDEIAEIRGVESIIQLPMVAEVDGDIQVASVLSTDPGTAMGDLLSWVAATRAAQYEDLEVFFVQQARATGKAVGTAASYMIQEHVVYDKNFWFPEDRPYLVGSNIGWNVGAAESADVGNEINGILTVYFTRRRATVTELNQILLKRR